ncbi:FG-GAP repeat domain-containing protein [Streptomyces sp. NPDC090798]|uniref:FG-GAP repeat domain-containing protein n=1 Tax=Streptomyces sp. NPDC090798 TaxID=3365968 RepID=UPI00380A10DC
MATITATGDLNGDGHGDLIARDSSGTLWLYPGTGHGTFGTRTSLGGGWKSMNRSTPARARRGRQEPVQSRPRERERD